MNNLVSNSTTVSGLPPFFMYVAGPVTLAVTDYSLYPEVCTLHTTSAETVIASMKAIFGRHGVPSEVFTENGPQFNKTMVNCGSLPKHRTLLTQHQVLTTRTLTG